MAANYQRLQKELRVEPPTINPQILNNIRHYFKLIVVALCCSAVVSDKEDVGHNSQVMGVYQR